MDTTPGIAPMPPDAALIRLARIGAGITVTAASAASKTATSRGVSVPRWNQVEGNRETRDGQTKPPHPKPQTVAMMALGVNRAARSVVISPERLKTEGENPEAATFLAEMLAQEPATGVAQPAPASAATAFPWTPDGRFLTADELADAAPEATVFLAAVNRAQELGLNPDDLDGADLFPDDASRALAWDTVSQWPWQYGIWMAARGLRKAQAARGRRQAAR